MEGEESITMAWVEDTDDILLMMDRDTVRFQCTGLAVSKAGILRLRVAEIFPPLG